MNSSTRVLAQLASDSGTSEVQQDRLTFSLAAALQGSSDDSKRPYTHAISFVESVVKNRATEALRRRYAAQITAEALR